MSDETTAADVLADTFREILPKSAHKHVAELVAEAMGMLDGVCSIEAVGAHIEVDSVVYPGGSIGLDAAGNMVSASLDSACHVDLLV